MCVLCRSGMCSLYKGIWFECVTELGLREFVWE